MRLRATGKKGGDPNQPPDKQPKTGRDYVAFLQLLCAFTVVQFFVWLLTFQGFVELSAEKCVGAAVKSVFLLVASHLCVKTTSYTTILPVGLNILWLNFALPAYWFYYLICVYLLTVVKTAVVTVIWYDSVVAKMDKKGMAAFMLIIFLTDLMETLYYCDRYWTSVGLAYNWSEGPHFRFTTETETMSLYITSCMVIGIVFVVCICVLCTYGNTAYQEYGNVRVMQIPEDILAAIFESIARGVTGFFTAIVQCVRNVLPTRDNMKRDETEAEDTKTSMPCNGGNAKRNASNKNAEDMIPVANEGFDDSEEL